MKEDSDVIIKKLKSVLNKEEEYGSFLYVIEESVTNEYLKNKQIKDKTIISYLKNFLKNIDEEINYFNSDFEKYLYFNFVEVLEVEQITKHELDLCVKYILWSIDNRDWLEDSQAYVKWITYTSGIMDKKDMGVYELKIRNLCKNKGISQEHTDAILSNDFDDIEMPNKESVGIESEFYGLNNDQKFDFVIEHFQQYPFLGEMHYWQLMGERDYDVAEKLCITLLEKFTESPSLEMSLGVVYKEKKNKILAKYYFENALKNLNEISLDIIPEKEIIIKQLKDLIKDLND